MKLMGTKAPVARLEVVSYDHPMGNHYTCYRVFLVHLDCIKQELMAQEVSHVVNTSLWDISKKMTALQTPSGARITVSY